jgi:hypothetical protein
MVHFVHSIWPTASQFQMLVTTFGLYLLSVLVFAAWYYLLHRHRVERFQFASDIQESQGGRARTRAQRSLSALEQEINAMEEVWAALKGAVGDEVPAALPSGHTFRTVTYRMTLGDRSRYQDRLVIQVRDENGSLLCDVEGPQDEPVTRDYLIRWLDKTLGLWRLKRTRMQRWIVRVSADPRRSFGFLDFVYFSTITQTTVGYGDILPNSTAVRMIVVGQILFGYVILFVLLNLILVSA